MSRIDNDRRGRTDASAADPGDGFHRGAAGSAGLKA